jgi:RiboL-PSP-HEPN
MHNSELVRQHARLRNLLRRIGHAETLKDPELQAHWARYVCILAAGFIENAARILFSSYARRQSAPAVANFAEAQLARFQNMNSQRMIDLAMSFDKPLARAFEEFIADSGRDAAIDSIVSTRHQIAHGKDATISPAQLESYLDRAVQAIEFLEQQLR